MATADDHIQRLEDAGILKQDHFSGPDRKILESLSEEEVTTLIRLRAKMGAAPDGKDHMRPNIVV